MVKKFVISSVLALLTLTACGKSENKSVSDENASQNDAQKNAETTVVSESRSIEALEAEWALKALKPAVIEETSELKTLKQKAETGDEAAYEALGLYYAKLPKSREAARLAREAFNHVKHHKNAEAAFLRGKAEFESPETQLVPELLDRAAAHIIAAAKMENLDALAMSTNYPSLVIEDVDVFGQINKLYALKAANKRDGKILYQWSKALENADFEVAGEKGAELMREAAALGYPEAVVQDAENRMIDTNNIKQWKNGFEQMQKAAQSGNADANSRLAFFLIQYKTNTEHEGFSPEIVSFVDRFVSQSGVSIDELALKYISNGLGNDTAFQVLDFLTSVETIDKAKIVKLLIQQIDAFSKESASRDACDLMMTFPWKPLHESKYLSDTEFAQIGQKVMHCYEDALARGDDWLQVEGYAGHSTAVKLAEHYLGKDIFEVDTNAELARNYLAFGAVNDCWDAQSMLAVTYRTDVSHAYPDRACFWNKKTSESALCSKICKSPAAEFLENCASCNSIEIGLKSCADK